MATIVDPHLHVEEVSGRPGVRRVIVTYTLQVDEDDLSAGDRTREHAVVRAKDLHDAPSDPDTLAIELSFTDQLSSPGVYPRRLTAEVRRPDLDVQRDWWRTDHGGGVEPILELADHLVADLTVDIGDTRAAAVTPIITGSWGALGPD